MKNEEFELIGGKLKKVKSTSSVVLTLNVRFKSHRENRYKLMLQVLQILPISISYLHSNGKLQGRTG